MIALSFTFETDFVVLTSDIIFNIIKHLMSLGKGANIKSLQKSDLGTARMSTHCQEVNIFYVSFIVY